MMPNNKKKNTINDKISKALSKSRDELFQRPVVLSPSKNKSPPPKGNQAIGDKKTCSRKNKSDDDFVNKESPINIDESPSHTPDSRQPDPVLEVLVEPIISKNDIVGIDGPHTKIMILDPPHDATDAVFVASCVNADPPYKSHPYRLRLRTSGVGHGCEKGVISEHFNCNDEFALRDVVLERVTNFDKAKESLADRENVQVDPFSQGFHWDEEQVIPRTFRICFQAFLKFSDGSLLPLEPKLSNILKDTKARPEKEIKIKSISEKEIPVEGDKTVVIKCENVTEGEDIRAILEHRDEKSGKKLWSCTVKSPELSLDNESISFLIPPYKDLAIQNPIKIKFCLFRSSDRSFSRSHYLWYIPKSPECKVEMIEPDEDIGESHNEDAKSKSDFEPNLLEESNHSKSSSDGLPKINGSFSITNCSRESIKGDKTEDDSGIIILDDISPFKPKNSPEMSNLILDDPKMVSTLQNSVRTLTKALNAEREANKYFVQQAKSLQEQNDELQSLNDLLEQKLESIKVENEVLNRENKFLAEDVKALSEENIKLSDKIAVLEQSSMDRKDKSMIEHLRQEMKQLQNKIEALTKTNHELRAQQASQSRGVANMKWQLEQKESLIRALESKLEETYPILGGETSSSCATSKSTAQDETQDESGPSTSKRISSNKPDRPSETIDLTRPRKRKRIETSSDSSDSD